MGATGRGRSASPASISSFSALRGPEAFVARHNPLNTMDEARLYLPHQSLNGDASDMMMLEEHDAASSVQQKYEDDVIGPALALLGMFVPCAVTGRNGSMMMQPLSYTYR